MLPEVFPGPRLQFSVSCVFRLSRLTVERYTELSSFSQSSGQSSCIAIRKSSRYVLAGPRRMPSSSNLRDELQVENPRPNQHRKADLHHFANFGNIGLRLCCERQNVVPSGVVRLIRFSSPELFSIGIVLLLRTETTADGYLLHAGSMSSSSATRGLLSGASASVRIPAASNELPLPAPTSSLLVPTTCAILLLSATSSQGPVTALHFLCELTV